MYSQIHCYLLLSYKDNKYNSSNDNVIKAFFTHASEKSVKMLRRAKKNSQDALSLKKKKKISISKSYQRQRVPRIEMDDEERF